MHLKRWITSLVGLPLLLLLVFKGSPLLFTALITVVSCLSLVEFFRIEQATAPSPLPVPIQLTAYATAVCIIASAYARSFEAMVLFTCASLLVSGLLSILNTGAYADAPTAIAKQALAVIYLPVLLSLLVFLRMSPQGSTWIFFLLAVVFAGDVGAYYAGSYWGRHKLCPAISPGKTIEGSIGGLIANVFIGAAAKLLLLPSLPWGWSLLFFVAAGAAGQVGDLFESQLKRAGGIKDSGSLLPGHGGLLDRIDALLFTTPVVYLFYRWFMG